MDKSFKTFLNDKINLTCQIFWLIEIFEINKNFSEENKKYFFCGTSFQVEPVCSLPQYCKPDVPCFLINKEKVKEKGGKAQEAWNNVNSAFTFGMVDYSGIFDLENRDSFIGGDLQENCLELLNKLGWTEEFEELKRETINSYHPLAKLIAKMMTMNDHIIIYEFLS